MHSTVCIALMEEPKVFIKQKIAKTVYLFSLRHREPFHFNALKVGR